MFKYKAAGLLDKGAEWEDFICVEGNGPDVTILVDPAQCKNRNVVVCPSEVDSFVDVYVRELTLDNAKAVLAFVNKTTLGNIELEEGAVVSV